MKISGYILDGTDMDNAVIFCYKDYKKAKDVYDKKMYMID